MQLDAWTQVEAAIRQVGGYSSVAFDDPRIHVVILAMGGWIRLCSVLCRDLPYRAREFQTRYQGWVCQPER